MADSLGSTVRVLISTLSSPSAHRGALAAQLASDLYTLSVESVSDTQLGKHEGKSLLVVELQLFVFCWPWHGRTAYCSSVLFHKENGILHFLRESATLDEVSAWMM